MATGGKTISMKELPVGHRLNPSDEELVNHHLNRKLLNIEEEYCSIPEFDIYKLPPWDLITKYNELSDLASDGRECFFYHRQVSGKRQNRKTKGKEGFWKGTGKGMKSKETDQTKWHKSYLVYKLGKDQKSAEETNWAMHKYVNLSDTRIVVCRIRKKEPKKGKKKVYSVSSESGPNGCPGAYASSETQNEPLETSPEASLSTTMASVHTTTESQNPTPTSDISVAESSMSSPQQMQIVAEGRYSPSEDSHADFIRLLDLKGPQDPCNFTREQSPYFENTFINGCDQEDGSWSYLGNNTHEEGGNVSSFAQTPADQSLNDVMSGSISPKQKQVVAEERYSPSEDSRTDFIQLLDLEGPQDPCILTREQSPYPENTFINECDQEDGSWSYLGNNTREEGGNVSSFDQTPADWWLNDVLSGSISPPQPQMMPTEDICNTSFNGSGILPQLDVHGHEAQFPITSTKYGAHETNFKEAPQSTLNSQTSISPPNSYSLSLEELQILQYTDSWLDSLYAPSPPTYASTGALKTT